MSKHLTRENTRRAVALVAALQQILEHADEAELCAQLAELQESIDHAVRNPHNAKGTSVLQVIAADANRLMQVYSQLDALAKEPANSVQFPGLCQHLREALLELGMTGQRKMKNTAARGWWPSSLIAGRRFDFVLCGSQTTHLPDDCCFGD